MSHDNVEIVKRLQPQPGEDFTGLFRDDERWARAAALLEPQIHTDLETGFVRAGETVRYRGLDGFRKTWLDWLEPWESYRTETMKIVPHESHVLLLVHDYGRRHGMRAEVRLRGAAVWTVREGRLARAFFYTDREDAVRDVGVSTAILDGE